MLCIKGTYNAPQQCNVHLLMSAFCHIQQMYFMEMTNEHTHDDCCIFQCALHIRTNVYVLLCLLLILGMLCYVKVTAEFAPSVKSQ